MSEGSCSEKVGAMPCAVSGLNTPPAHLAGSERVLVVDDEPAIVRATVNALRWFGYKPTACSSSEEARALFSVAPEMFDLVITDHNMPGLTGAELAKDLTILRPDLPVILCTGYDDVENEILSKSAGVRKFLAKPFMPSVLMEAIREILDGGAKTAD